MRWALLLAGGATRGALQVGVAEHLWKQLGEPSAVAGVSVGALHALLLSEGRVEALRPLWREVGRAGTSWFQTMSPEPWNGAHTMDPLRRHMEEMGAGSSTRISSWVGVIDAASGEYRSIDLLPLKPRRRRHVTLVSASQPGVHKHIRWMRRWHYDGGVQHVMPLLPGWNTYDEIHAVFCRPIHGRRPEPKQEAVSQAWEQVAQALEQRSDLVIERDVARLKEWGQQVRVVIYAPKSWSVTGSPFDASEKAIERRLKAGERSATAPVWQS